MIWIIRHENYMADGFNQLQLLQGRKFLFSVKQGNAAQVEKLCYNGVPGIVNYIGKFRMCFFVHNLSVFRRQASAELQLYHCCTMAHLCCINIYLFSANNVLIWCSNVSSIVISLCCKSLSFSISIHYTCIYACLSVCHMQVLHVFIMWYRVISFQVWSNL